MIGYNLREAQKVLDKIYQDYNSLDKTIVSSWEQLKRLLRREWIGYDEEDYEKKFAKRLIDLSSTTSEMANSSMETIYNLAKAWHDFQSHNTLDGSEINVEPFKLEYTKTSPREEGSISSGGLQIDESTTKGLKNGQGSASVVHDAVNTFIKTIVQKANALSSSIKTERAFSGEQASAINAYLKKCSETTAALATSVDDLDQALDNLLSGNYGASVESVNQEFTSATSSLNDTLNNTDGSRWDA